MRKEENKERRGAENQEAKNEPARSHGKEKNRECMGPKWLHCIEREAGEGTGRGQGEKCWEKF